MKCMERKRLIKTENTRWIGIKLLINLLNLSSTMDTEQIRFILANQEGTTQFANSTLITGFYGVGKCGYIAVNHLVKILNAKRAGVILTKELPPFISVKGENLVFPFEIYVAKTNSGEKLTLLLPSFEPYKTEQQAFAKAVVEWSKEVNIDEIILIGGLDSRLKKDDTIGRALWTQAYKEQGKDTLLPKFEEGLYLTGPLALLIMFSELQNVPALGLLTYAERSRPDPIAAANAIKLLGLLFDTEFDVEELGKEAARIEEEIQQILSATTEEENEEHDRGLFA